MKQLYLLLSGILILLSSCEKPVIIDDEGTDEPAANTGNLALQIEQIEQVPFEEIRHSDLSVNCTRLNFVVYNMAGTRLKQVNQQKGDAAFGAASFQLDEGNYQLLVVAHSSNGNPALTSPAKVQFTNANGFTDTFIHYQTLTIAGEPQSLTLSLNRIVALCRVVVSGNYPKDVVRLQFVYKGGSGAFNAMTGFGCVNSTQKVTFDVTTGQKVFDLYTFLHATEGTIHLTMTALGAADNVIDEQSFDVPLEQKKITQLTGNFFDEDNPDNTSVRIEINTDWDDEVLIPF